MISIPIPDNHDKICYCDLRFDNNNTYEDLLKQLGTYKRYLSRTCHLDPDIYKNVLERSNGWKPIFGQIDSAQQHLCNQEVGKDDLFLFFGSFRKTKFAKGQIIFDQSQPEIHAVFGYLQVGENLKECFHPWMKYHPHVCSKRRLLDPTNVLYVAKEKLSWDRTLPGASPLCFNKNLVLTKKGFTKSKWNLDPHIFRGIEISYHPKPWRNNYFQSTAKGQEFVIQDNDKVEGWAKSIIQMGMNYDL